PVDGLSRTVDALRAVHRQAARPLALSHPGRAARGPARALPAGDGFELRALRAMDRADAGALRTASSEGARGFRRGAPLRRSRESAGHLARHAARRYPVERGYLRERTRITG